MHSRRNRPRRFSLRADGGMAANVHRAAETRFYDSEGRMSGYVLSNAVGCGVSVAFAYDGPYLTNAIHTLPCGNRFAARLTRATARTDLVTPCAQIFGGQSMYWLLTAYDLLGRPTSTTDSVSLAREWLYDRRSGLTKATVGTPDIFRHRFSTKHLDSGTGLYYYGYRFYVPSLMRWLNRDPIREDGGMNLYGFCGNSPICNFDSLGEKIAITEDRYNVKDNIGRNSRAYFSRNCSVTIYCTTFGVLKIDGVAYRRLSILTPGHGRWDERYKRYNRKWGVGRNSTQEWQAAYAHEMDHWNSFNALFSFLRMLNEFDGTRLCSKCNEMKDELEKQYRALYMQAVMRSSKYDSPDLNYGGAYPK